MLKLSGWLYQRRILGAILQIYDGQRRTPGYRMMGSILATRVNRRIFHQCCKDPIEGFQLAPHITKMYADVHLFLEYILSPFVYTNTFGCDVSSLR
jgi:hypothetical protein